MLIRFAWRAWTWRHLAVWSLLAIALVSSAFAQPAATPEPVAAAMERLKLTLDGVEAALKNEQTGARALTELRSKIVATRDELRAHIERLEPRAADVSARLKQLGPAPADDAPAEEPTIAAERKQLTADFSQIDGNLKQARLLAVRTDQLSERISEKRRALYARELLERGASVLDPSSWTEAAEAAPGTLRSFGSLLQVWAETVFEAGAVRVVPAGLLLVLILAAAIGLTRWWLPRFDVSPRDDTRFARARTAVMVFVWLAARTPLALIAAVMVLDAFSLLTYRMTEIASGLVAAVVAAAFGRGVARGLLAPERPERRIVKLDDHTAGCFHDHLVWGTRIFGVAIFLQVVNKTLFAPLAMTVAANALFALAIAGLLLHMVRCLRKAEIANGGDAIITIPGARLSAWVLASAIVLTLITGYVALAAFLALRTVVAATVLGALYLLLVATDALFTEALAPETPLGRRIAANLGLPARSVALLDTLLSATLRVALILLAVLVIFGPWEVSTADLMDSMQSVPLGLQIGEITISFRAILLSLVVLLLVLLVTRVAQRWLQREFLPRTTLEPSLQLSISTIFGYAGAIIGVTLAMAGLGIDLQKIALVAGALSVGIGFGLQSIVSNFVSGLILLAERPIRVGDSIVVQGEEGSVRRIRVRATEIETPQRASVIIPNSVLISGMVKNWTHANTMGQILLKIGVGYDSDAEQVRELLLAVANDHPQVTKNPAPGAFFMAFGDSALEFELRCVVANVNNGLSVRSDLNLEILKRCRAAGIEIPYPQREVRLRGNGAETMAPASLPGSTS